MSGSVAHAWIIASIACRLGLSTPGVGLQSPASHPPPSDPILDIGAQIDNTEGDRMEIRIHRDKMARLDELRRRLDPVEDFELWMWTSMNAATHGMNACLHHLGLTQPSPYYPHQIPGLYVAPNPVEGKWQELFAAPGDVIHTGLDSFEGHIPDSIAMLSQELEKIEDLREVYVRGGKDATPDVSEGCRLAYERCRDLIQEILTILPDHHHDA
jgi:hypothetical protein